MFPPTAIYRALGQYLHIGSSVGLQCCIGKVAVLTLLLALLLKVIVPYQISLFLLEVYCTKYSDRYFRAGKQFPLAILSLSLYLPLQRT